MKPSVYIETTIVSYLTAHPSRDLIRSAQQQITREWWEQRRASFDFYTSQFAVIEASAGDTEAAGQRLAVLSPLPVLDITTRVTQLARGLVAAAALPSAAGRDAEHVAVCAIHGIDYLLTWNCRHLANAFLRDRIEQVCMLAGFTAPIICTPEELLEGEP